MSVAPVVVALTDGEENLAHYLDLLRRQGYRVLVTSRPYEAVLFVARNRVTNVLLRRALIPDPADDFLRQIREFSPSPFTVVMTPQDESERSAGLGDLVLPEPFLYSSLLQALEYGTERCRERGLDVADVVSHLDGQASPLLTPARLSVTAPRLLAQTRRMSELERDREQLLTSGLEMFLEAAECDRGSIMLRTTGDNLRVSRRVGCPVESDRPGPQDPGEAAAQRVAQTKEPLLLSDVTEPLEADDVGRRYMVVPILDRRTLLGVVTLADRRGGEPFHLEDLEVVRLLAAQFAVNLTNATIWQDLQRMAVVDPLTGLFNRRFFDRQISVELQRARRFQRKVTLALMDIDNFKVINDVNGYAAGDAVIRVASSVIRSNFREVDVVTRWGGDEFAIILPEAGPPAAAGSVAAADAQLSNHHYVDRVRQAVAESDFNKASEEFTGIVTVSAGVATFPDDAQNAVQLFAAANAALKMAKHGGNNRLCAASDTKPTPGQGPLSPMELESDESSAAF